MHRETEPGTDAAVNAPAGAGPVVVPEPTTADLVNRAVRTWRAGLAVEAGDSALSDVDRLRGALLDLSAAHPSGIAQLFAGRPTRLSNLVREGSALSSARRHARAVATRADEYAQRYGLASAFLTIGVARWSEDAAVDAAVATDPTDRIVRAVTGATPVPDPNPAADDVPAQMPEAGRAPDDGEPATEQSAARTVRAPVLLRPVTIRRRSGDVELALEPALEVNPVLAAALRRSGALLDPAVLARGAFTAAGFDPRPALDRLRALGAATLTDFTLDERLLVGTFVHPEQALLDDLDALADVVTGHEVLAALAGDERSVAALAHPLPQRRRGDRDLDEERGVGDLDPVQMHVLDVLAAGHHLLLDAPPGSDVAGTVAAVVAEAAAAGRTVLYVAGHRRSADAVIARLDALGLGEVVLDVAPESGWRERAGRRLLGAMTIDAVDYDVEQMAVVRRELVDRRSRLQRYIDALHRPRAPWQTSAYDALQALARLTFGRPVPQTTVRLNPAVAEALTAENRSQAAADLVRVAALGGFDAAIRTSPWYGADLPTADRAARAVERAERLVDALPRLRSEAARVAEETGLTAAGTPDEWTEQLRMLAGIRTCLDVFRPLIFERSAADLVAATAERSWREEHGVDMPGAVRRRLRRQAKDMLRPGRPVEDLHGALVEVQRQREVWRAHCPAGGWPRIPEGLAGIEAEHEQIRADVDELSAALGIGLGGVGWDELGERVQRLLDDRASLDTLPERTALVRSLAGRGLGDLLTDLADRQVSIGVVGAELELAWWSTVFEAILREDPALAGHDGATLARLVAEFRVLDRRFLSDRGALAAAAVVESVRTRMQGVETETEELFAEIVQGGFTTLRDAVQRYPRVARHLRPCLVAAPMLVPHLLPAARHEDLVVLDAADHMALNAVVPALARGRQVLVIGDSRCGAGTAMADLGQVLPAIALPATASRQDPHLTAFLATHGYGDRVVPTPLPSAQGLLRLELVDGTGMPGPDGMVEGTGPEVARVVDLVTEHVLARPDESLAVVSPSRVHADRVRDAVHALVPDSPALAAFVDREPEAFVVVDLASAQGLSRDALILSLGYGRTPHGRVLHRFGSLGDPGGDVRLLQALGAGRHRVTVVSCFGASDLDPERLRSPGAVLLADLLELAERRSAAAASPGELEPGADPDRLVLDLAERLWRMGLVVEVEHGIEGGSRIPLVVGHPDLPGEMLVAVLTDDDAYVTEPSVRVRDRQVPERLERLGWSVVQVWSAAAFLDPQAEADAICGEVLRALADRRRDAQLVPPPMLEEPADVDPPMETAVDVPGGMLGDDEVPEDPAGDDEGPVEDVPADDEPTDEGQPDALMEAEPLLRVRGPRPPIEVGMSIGDYSDDQLDELASWIVSDGLPRDVDEVVSIMRTELGIRRRGARIDAALSAAARRAT